MHALNLPPFPFKIRKDGGINKIFDPIRKKYLVLTPEEWVRQHFVQYLATEKGYPRGLFRMEGGIKHGQRKGRYDILFYHVKGHPLILIECKAPSVKISSETLYQVARYNANLKVPFLVLTNGLDHHFFKIDFLENKFLRLEELPHYQYFSEK